MNRIFFSLRLACILFGVACLASFADAATWYVATTGSNSNPGTQANPFATLQKAVNTASNGDTILLADGTYTGTGNRDVDFGGIDLTVKSASNNPATCLIDCQQIGRAFNLHNNETANSHIIGLTIKNGSAAISDGGGIYINNSDSMPTVTNCVFTSNSADFGGGMYGGAATNCIFTGNAASYRGGGICYGAATKCVFTSNSAAGNGGGGGGMYSGTALNCVFTANSASSASYGGGMYYGTATNCIFTGNSAVYSGGGMYRGAATNCIFTNNLANNFGGGMASGTATKCIFTGNSAPNGGGMDGSTGGAATNCVFIGNVASGSGGGMSGGTATNCVYTGNSSSYGGGLSGADLYFCTVANNNATINGGGIYGGTAVNCIVWGNTAGSTGPSIYGGATVNYSDVQRGYATGNGNINVDPQFVNYGGGDFHLSAGSPCVGAGTANTSYGPGILPTTDRDGNPRVSSSAPDMGAYEYQSSGVSVGTRKLVWQNQNSGDVVDWLLTGTTHNTTGFFSQGIGAVWQVVAYADITGNGYPAIIWQNQISGDVYYWQTNASGPTATRGYLSQGISSDWKIAAVSDVNGDGQPDLIWQNQMSGDVYYWQMNGTTHNGGGFLSQGIPPVWKIVAAADVTGDGKNDLIWQNQTSGDVYYWQMNNTIHNGGGYLSQGIAPVWRVAAVSDVNGDGLPDLIWQNQTSGDVYYWQMNNAIHSGGGFLSQSIPPDWKVVGLN